MDKLSKTLTEKVKHLGVVKVDVTYTSGRLREMIFWDKASEIVEMWDWTSGWFTCEMPRYSVRSIVDKVVVEALG